MANGARTFYKQRLTSIFHGVTVGATLSAIFFWADLRNKLEKLQQPDKEVKTTVGRT